PVLWGAAVILALVLAIIVVCVARFRHRPGQPEPRQIHGNTRLEVAWTIAPALLLAVVAVPTIKTIGDLAEEPGGNALQVRVIGHQWWWEYRYEDLDLVTANELHIPVGRSVRLSLEATSPEYVNSPSGVIHSFWVPRLAGKQDVVPGRTTKLTIAANEPGTYLGQCAEFCGLSHANMRLRVIAQAPSDFEAWVRSQQRPASPPAGQSAAKGLELFVGKGTCLGCHTVKGEPRAAGIIGPNLTHFMSRGTFAGAIFENNTDQLTKWLDNPSARKPGSIMPDLPLTPEEIADLVAYLETLR
ncbi:MAG: cytochrome c oxidase subunit II, partial [Acidimicrobiia bacterium]